ncbi:MAG: hypothetical protein ACMUIG_03145 [Thermoplasmatota archaeon]
MMSTRKKDIINESRVCYYTTPKSQRSFIRSTFYIYDCKGSIKLHKRFIEFDSDRYHIEIPLRDIVRMGIGRFSRFQKPVTLNFLMIEYRTPMKRINTIYITPTISAVTFVWNTNKIVKAWFNDILKLNRRIKVIESKYTQ